jgi:diguanylate cyclase (GGDEF)-like protein/PAS domain S-box-containing protein
MALLVCVTLGVFAQGTAPMMFLIYPALILVLLRLGLGWAALASLFVAFAGGWFTLKGDGPLAASGSLSMEGSCLLLQVFVAAGVFMLYSVSVVLESRRAFERKLEKIVSLHNLVTENSRDAIILADFKGNRSYVSSAVERLAGWPPDKFAEFKSLELVHPAEMEAVKETIGALRSGVEGAMLECRVRTLSGDYIWVEANLRLVRDAKTNVPTGLLNIVRDVTERKLGEDSRAFHHSLIRAINEASLDAILVVNSDGNVVSYNRRFTEVWRIATPDCVAPIHDASTPIPDGRVLVKAADQVTDPQAFVKRVQEIYADPDAVDQCEIPLKDGRTIERYSTCLRSSGGQYLGRVWFFRDITERKLAEKRLQDAYKAVEALAATDAVTGLANRRHFDQTLGAEWRRSLRDHAPLSLLMIDADLFKSYNDTYGHTRGDNCLKQIAEAAQDVVCRPGDLVARFGGEEFAVILPNTDRKGAMQLGTEILAAMRERQLPHSGSPRGIVTVSVGCATMVASFGQHLVNLVEAADDALYEAKKRGRDQVAAADTSGEPQGEGVPARKRPARQTVKKTA